MRKKKIIIVIASILILTAGIITYIVLNSKKQTVTICQKPSVSSPTSNNTSTPSKPGIPNTSTPEPSSSTSTPINTVGNSCSNIINGGFAAVQGDWVYFNCNGSLCKEMLDMKTGRQKLCDGNVEYINVIGDWIYYSEQDSSTRECTIKKIKTDGTNKTTLLNSTVTNLIATTDYLYYIANDSHIYRYSFKEKTTTKLSNDCCNYFILDKDWIYYPIFSKDTAHSPKEFDKIKIDGSSKIALAKDKAVMPFGEYNDTLYSTTNDFKKIVITNLDGSKPLELNAENLLQVNFSNNCIWLCDSSFNINKVNHNNFTSTFVCNLSRNILDTNLRIMSINDYILIFDFPYIYKLNSDGTIETINQ